MNFQAKTISQAHGSNNCFFTLNLLQLDCGLRRNDVAESHFVGSILFDPTYA
jgi:hypothetical protein